MEHKAKIVFADKVWEKIEWFTYNFDTEIAAVGLVKQKKDKDGEKYFYVEELLFPKQKVSCATVNITSEGWSDLMKERGLNGLENMAFYWHRHPGSSAHSGTDDVDTFETFMSKEAGRKYFIFLQTAVSGEKWNQEARIDIRHPVRHTILNKDIRIFVEPPKETKEVKKARLAYEKLLEKTDKEIEKECKAIAKKSVIVETYTVYNPQKTYNEYQTQFGTHHSNLNVEVKQWDKYEKDIPFGAYETLDDAIAYGRYGKVEGTNYMDNDILNNLNTLTEEKVMITFEKGQATIVAGKLFGLELEQSLDKDKGANLSKFVREYKVDKANTPDCKKYNLQPEPKKYIEMKTCLTKAYFVFCEKIIVEIDKDIGYTPATDNSEVRAMQKLLGTDKNNDSYAVLTLLGKENIEEALNIFSEFAIIIWDNDVTIATILDMDGEGTLGYLKQNDSCNELEIHGTDAIMLLKEADDITRAEQEVREIRLEEEEE